MEWFFEILSISLVVAVIIVGMEIFIKLCFCFVLAIVPVSLVYLTWRGCSSLLERF